MQPGPELSDGLKERYIACIERTLGFHVARMIHIYLYAANRLWDTARISRLRLLPLKRCAMTHCRRPVAACGKIGRADPGRGRWAKIRQGGDSAGKVRRVIPRIIEKIETRAS